MAYNYLDSKLLTHPKFASYLRQMENVGQDSAQSQSKSTTHNGFSDTNGFNKEIGASPSVLNPETDHGTGDIQISVPWGHIAAKTHGPPNGQRVLAVHGWMDNAGTFDRLIPLLPTTLYIVAVDLPGHGLSSHLPLGTPYHFADYIITLRRIVNHLKWTKFAWLGHSMGAGLGVLYASIFPAQVEHLIMLDLTKPITGDSGNDCAGKIAVAVDSFLALEEKIQPIPPTHSYEDTMSRLMNPLWGTLCKDAAKALMVRGARRVGEEDKWYFLRDLRLRSPTVLRLSEDQCSTIVSNLRSATMIIKASKAPWFESEEVCQNVMNIYRKNCPVFRFVQVDGDHYVHLNEPEKCAGHINEFLTECKVDM